VRLIDTIMTLPSLNVKHSHRTAMNYKYKNGTMMETSARTTSRQVKQEIISKHQKHHHISRH